MAPKLIVEVIGDDSGLQRTLGHSSRTVRGFDKDLGRATRGALAGSGAFRSLGRSIAFASGGFLAFASAGHFLRTSIDAAKEAQVTQKQLAAQFRAAGKDVQDYQEQIDKTANRLSLLAGFENDELKAAFTTIFRTTSNVTLSLRDLGTAADLARAKHLALNQAALIIAKTEAGNTTLLRRQGFQIKQNATAEEALAQVRAAVAGQARAGTTAQERFGAVLHNTEEIIGTALLPTLNKYLTSLAKWLTKMNESGQLERDVQSATRNLQAAFEGIKAVIGPLAAAFKTLGTAVGGTRNEIKLLAEVVVGLKLAKLAGSLTGIGAAAGEAGAAGQVALLTSRLKTLGAIGTVVVTIELARKISGSDFGKKFGLDFSGADLVRSITKGSDPNDFVFDPSRGFVRKPRERLEKQIPFIQNLRRERQRPTLPQVAGGTTATRFAITPAQRRAIDLAGQPSFDALKAQRDFDKTQLAAIEERFKANKISGKTFTEQTIKFRNDLAQQESAIAAIVDEQNRKIADDAKRASDATKAAAAAARKSLETAAENASIFLESISRGVKLGVDTKKIDAANKRAADAARKAALKASQFAVPQGLQVAAARAGALGLDEQSKKIAERIRAAAFKAIKSGRLGFQGLLDAWNTIGSINDQLKTAVKGDLTKFRHVSTAKLLEGLNLTADQRRAARTRLATLGPGGTVPTRGPAFALSGGGPTYVLHNPQFHGVTNMRDFEDQLEKRARSRAHVRRGPR